MQGGQRFNRPAARAADGADFRKYLVAESLSCSQEKTGRMRDPRKLLSGDKLTTDGSVTLTSGSHLEGQFAVSPAGSVVHSSGYSNHRFWVRNNRQGRGTRRHREMLAVQNWK